MSSRHRFRGRRARFSTTTATGRRRQGRCSFPRWRPGSPSVRRTGGNYTYTVRVRSGFRFNDGRAVTAKDFVHAIHRDLAPALESGTGPLVLENLVSATSHGSSLAITMERPAPDLPALLSSQLFCAIPADLPARPTQRCGRRS